MNVKDLLNRETPFKIKLNNKFTLEESFDPGTVLLVKTIKEDETFDDGIVYKLLVSALKEDKEALIEQLETMILGLKTNFDWFAS